MTKVPNPNTAHPVNGYNKLSYVKAVSRNSHIIVGDFTYISDSEFDTHVHYLHKYLGDRLIIGKFCQIGPGVEFIMNGANHQMGGVSTFPFYMLGWNMDAPAVTDLTFKGDTVIGNDVWIGQNSTILPGVHIGDGAIIGANSVVGHDVEPYSIVAGNPIRLIRKRFDDEMIGMLLRLKWWDKPIQEIDAIIPILTSSDLVEVKNKIRTLLEE